MKDTRLGRLRDPRNHRTHPLLHSHLNHHVRSPIAEPCSDFNDLSHATLPLLFCKALLSVLSAVTFFLFSYLHHSHRLHNRPLWDSILGAPFIENSPPDLSRRTRRTRRI